MNKPVFPPLRIIKEGQLPEGTDMFKWKELWWYWLAVGLIIVECVFALLGVGING